MQQYRPNAAVYPNATYAWYVCGVLLLAYIFSFLDRSIISLLVIPIEQDLAINDTQMSLLQGLSFALFYAVLGLPIARLVDARSRRGVVAAGILVWSVMTAACGLATHFWYLFLARIGVGAGEATLLPSTTSLMADYFQPHRRGLALGIFATGIFFGSGFALIVGGRLVDALAAVEMSLPVLGTLHPWQVVFFAVGLPGILVAALALTVREPPRLGTRTLRGARGLPLGEVFAYAQRNGATIACHNLGFTLLAFASLAASAWVPTIFVRVHGWTAGQIGIRFGILVLIFGPVGSIAGGWLADFYQRRGRRTGKLFVGMVAAIGCIPFSIAFPLVHDATGSVALMMPFLFFVSFVWGLAPAALQEIMPNEMRGQATALYTGLVNLVGGGLGPYSVAVIADHVFHDPAKLNIAMSIVVPIALAGAALLFWLGTEPYIATLDRLKTAAGRAEP